MKGSLHFLLAYGPSQATGEAIHSEWCFQEGSAGEELTPAVQQQMTAAMQEAECQLQALMQQLQQAEAALQDASLRIEILQVRHPMIQHLLLRIFRPRQVSVTHAVALQTATSGLLGLESARYINVRKRSRSMSERESNLNLLLIRSLQSQAGQARRQCFSMVKEMREFAGDMGTHNSVQTPDASSCHALRCFI